MKNLVIFSIFLILSSCCGFKEDNKLAIPPVASTELNVTK